MRLLTYQMPDELLAVASGGEFDEFDPEEIAKHRSERDSKLTPLHDFTLRATVPWALLMAQEFELSRRAKEFD